MIKLQNFFIFFVAVLPSAISRKPVNCDRTCAGGPFNPIPYPFGFSSGCQIELNCTSNGTVFIGEFPVQQINPDDFLVSLPAKCGRTVDALTQLYGEHYSPMSTNAILMKNCTDQQMKNCMIPMTPLLTHIELVNCSGGQGGGGNMSCYSGDINRMFLDYENVMRMGCRNLFSGVATEMTGGSAAVSLDVQMIRLGWWVKGTCDCSGDADCTAIVSPVDGSDGHRCKCKSGFDGDGYKASSGCRRQEGSMGASQKRKWKLKLVIGLSCSIAGILMLLFFVIKKRLWETQKSHGQPVAVKVLSKSIGDGTDFINEVASISRTSHINIVTLLGFCIEGKKRALMYEFMANGSLDKFLYSGGPRLDWNTLFLIAKGIARGLEYLHQGCNTRIVHFDIKPHNILLDEEFVPKISDFGLAKLCRKKESIVSIMDARGTAGYMAPEVFFKSLGGASHKADVYSYGMMVLEMTGARTNNNTNLTSASEAYFPDWIYKQVESRGSLEDYGVTTKEEEDLARKMLIVSLWCVQSDPSDRPSISKVVEMLEGSIESLQVPPRNFRSSSPTRSVKLSGLAWWYK